MSEITGSQINTATNRKSGGAVRTRACDPDTIASNGNGANLYVAVATSMLTGFKHFILNPPRV